MEKRLIIMEWPGCGHQVKIGEILNFISEGDYFIEVNDGKDLAIGVELS